MDKFCVLMGCNALPVIRDSKNYSKWRTEAIPFRDDFEDGPEQEREIWYCADHAKTYLWPIIDRLTGNSVDGILSEFKSEGMF